MTEETATWLDYSNPPPGYEMAPARNRVPANPSRTMLAIMWTHYKAEHDPPGLTVESIAADAWWVRGMSALGKYESEDEARAAAWAWHDRRLALAGSLTFGSLGRKGEREARENAVVASWEHRGPLWPRCLTWTDEQVAEVERWLEDSTAEMPEVLRG